MIGPGSDKNEHLVCVFLWMWMCVCVSIFCKWLREQLFMLISHQVLRAKLNSRIYMGCCNKWSENANHCQEFFTKTVEIRWKLRCKFLTWKSGFVNFLTYHVCPAGQKRDILSRICSLGQNVELEKIFCSHALGFHTMLTNFMYEMFHDLCNVSTTKNIRCDAFL